MSDTLIFGCIGVLLAVICLGFALRAERRRRLIDNLPTSKTTGVFIGLVEIKGTAEVERPLTSYLAEIPCVYYSWTIEEHWSRTVTETYRDSQGHTRTRTRHESGWKTIADGSKQILFYVRDDCGVVRVDPRRAKIEAHTVMHEICTRNDALYYGKGPAHSIADSDHRRRFIEKAIPLHRSVYVMGQARERKDVIAAEIAYHKDAPLFLISTRSEQQISRGLGMQYWGLGLLGLLLSVAGWIAPCLMRRYAPVAPPYDFIISGTAYIGVWILGWVWMVYNSLVGLRHRVRQAWANVDVQLKRRTDLIPNVVRVVEAFRDHEHRVHTELAALRTQTQATAPGQTGPDPQGCSRLLLAIAESYPELKASTGFLELQKTLSDTEQRIALARGYFNEIATHYNTRLATIPDCCLAALARLREQPLLTATDFERAPVSVQLADD